MDAESPDLIGFGLRSHLRALERLWLLYRDPHRFREWLERQSVVRQLTQALMLILHALPHMTWVKFAIAYGLWRFSILELPPDPYDVAYGIGVGIALGIGVGIGFSLRIAGGVPIEIPGVISLVFSCGIGVGISYGIGVGIANRITGGASVAIGVGIAYGIANGISIGISFGIVGRIAFGIATGLVIGLTFGLALGLALGIDVGIAYEIAFGIAVTRVYYLAPHLAFVWPLPRGSWYRWHPVAWDQLCTIPFPRFDLVLTNP